MVRVLVCDDQVVVCEGLRAILSTSSQVQVVGVAYDGEQAVKMAMQHKPDVILMDLKMPVMNGIQATQMIRREFPQIKVLVLTTYDFDDWVLDAIRNGAAGYLLKDTPREQLITAILGTAEGRTYIDPSVAGKVFAHVGKGPTKNDQAALGDLSDRELDVLRLLAHGLSNPEIAQRLYLSEGTVRNYVSALITKLQVADRTQAAILALRTGLVDLGHND